MLLHGAVIRGRFQVHHPETVPPRQIKETNRFVVAGDHKQTCLALPLPIKWLLSAAVWPHREASAWLPWQPYV